MPEPGIFRKSSLERLSTPEQLDYLMQVTTPKGWYALWTLCGLLAIALIWSVVGSLPTAIDGPALIMPPRGVDDIYAPENGVIDQIFVKEGDVVKAGDIVATLKQDEMKERTTRTKGELEQKIAAVQESISAQEKQVAARQQALDQGLIAPMELENAKQTLANQRSQLRSLQNQLALGGMDVKNATEVRAQKAGKIVEVISSQGALVHAGDGLMTYVDDKEPLNALAFIPSVGNQAKPGMDGEISPRTVKKEEFGYLKGKVYFVSQFPVRQSMLYDLTHNTALDTELSANGAPYLLRLTLEQDPSTFSGYKWSSSGGPQEPVTAGMMCDVRVIVRRQKPITLVIPALKSFFGL